MIDSAMLFLFFSCTKSLFSGSLFAAELYRILLFGVPLLGFSTILSFFT